jgi:3-phenylpropionate/trans-cinnamate dioxygenase ferredoxin subunit
VRYLKAAAEAELKNGGKMKVTLEGRVLLLANVDGMYYALDNRCPHMGGSLADGTLDGTSVICPKHKTAFDLKTGKVTTSGKLAFIPLKVDNVRAYPVKLEGNNVLVGLD